MVTQKHKDDRFATADKDSNVTDGPVAEPASAGQMVTQTEWVDLANKQPHTSACHVLQRKLAGVSRLEFAGSESAYSFAGFVQYSVNATDELTILNYEACGVHVDGIDLGEVIYRYAEPRTIRTAPNGTFEVAMPLIWTDAFNYEARVDAMIRGTLLTSNVMSFLSASITGAISIDQAGESSLVVDVPAVW
jgi:hypothetical protein